MATRTQSVSIHDRENVEKHVQILKAEYDQLQERAARFHTVSGLAASILESSDDVIVSKDLGGTITSWNAAATALFGYTADEMIGRSILTLIPEHLHPDENTIMENIRAGRRIEHFETIRRTKAGELIDVSLTISPIKDEHGWVIGASKILRDISAQKRIEGSLLQAEKLATFGRVAATIAHEINNPLEAVINLIFLAKSRATDPEMIDYLATAERELDRLSQIARRTLGFYREHASASSIALAEIVEQTIAVYAPRCEASIIAIHRRIDSTRRVMMHRGEMMQVAANLITNSIDAMPDGGVISISVQDSDNPDGVVMVVEDTGGGISESDLPRVFEAFFTTRSTVGTGIGLFVAKQFVEGHGGSITIASDTSDDKHGTAVSVFLPIHTTHDTPQELATNNMRG